MPHGQDSINPEWTENGQSGTVVVGGTKIGQLADVVIVAPGAADGNVLIFDFATKNWVAAASGAAAPVFTVHGRVGDVVGAEGDYGLDQMGDVNITTPLDAQSLVYVAANNRWENATPAPSNLVSSVFTRTGDISAQAGDYTAALVDNVTAGSTLLADDVQGAVDELDGKAETNEADIATNVTNIGNNATNIATNVTGISDNVDAIATNAADILDHPHQPVDAIAEVIPTGITAGGNITEIAANATQVDISAGAGQIVDSYTQYGATTIQGVVWLQETVDLLNPTTEQTTHFSVDSGGNILTSNTSPSPTAFRTSIQLGRAFHDPFEVNPPIITNQAQKPGHTSHALIDLVEFAGPFTQGLELVANAGLTVKRLAGTFFQIGVNEDVSATDPNVKFLPETDPVEFFYFLADGSIESVAIETLFDFTQIDLGGGGALTPVGGGGLRATTQWVFALGGGIGGVLYGQIEHNTFAIAKASVLSDRNQLIIPQNLVERIGPIWAITAISSVSDLSDLATAEIFSFLEGGGGGGGGGGGSGAVTTVFARIGDIVSADNDYTASQVANVPAAGIVATDVQAAITELAGLSGGPIGLDDLTDVILTDPVLNHILAHDGAGIFRNVIFPTPVQQLDQLSDVTIAGPVNKDVLKNDGAGQFINGPQTAEDVVVTPAGAIIATDVQAALVELDAEIQAIPAVPAGLDDLDDVTIVAPALNHVLKSDAGGLFTNGLMLASQVSNAPTGAISSTDVQGAINELEALVAALDVSNFLAVGNRSVGVNVRAIVPAEVDGCGVISTVVLGGETYQYRSFDNVIKQTGYVDVPIPKSANLTGTFLIRDIEYSYGGVPTFHGIVWEVSALLLKDAEDMAAATYGTAVLIPDTGADADTIYLAPQSSGITAGGSWTRDITTMRVKFSRNVSDGGNTLDVPARLHGFEIIWFVDLVNDA